MMAAPLIGSIVAVLALGGPDDGATADDAPGATYDCGFVAISLLLEIEGHATDLDRLASWLPGPSPGGYSMKDLRDAGRRAGLRLVGVRLDRPSALRAGPALVSLRQGRHGHFALVRPVGHTGKLVQVLDSDLAPTVVDADDLLAQANWTGLALIRERSAWTIWLLIPLVASLAAILAWPIVRRWAISSGRPTQELNSPTPARPERSVRPGRPASGGGNDPDS